MINKNKMKITMSNNKQSSVEWLSNQTYELFEQYLEGNFDRITLNKLVLEATEQAKAMHKEEIKDAFVECWKLNVPDGIECKLDAEQYYNTTFKSE
jgi:hypothetical protein